MISALSLGAALLIAQTARVAPAPAKTVHLAARRIAVRGIDAGYGAPPKLAETLSALLTAELRKRPKLNVTSQEDIVTLLSLQRQKQLLQCDDASCLSEIGGALGAGELVTGGLSLVGQEFLLVVRVIDVRHAKVRHEATRRLAAPEQGKLIDAVTEIADELFPDAPAPHGDSLGLELADQPALQSRSILPPLLTGIGGLVLAGVGIGLLADALSVPSTTNSHGVTSYQTPYATAQGKNGSGTAGVVLISIGGAFGAGGLIWGLLQ